MNFFFFISFRSYFDRKQIKKKITFFDKKHGLTPLEKYGFWDFNPFAPGDFAEKHVLKVLEWFSGHCPAIKG